MHELRTGLTCQEHFSGRGNRKSEEKYPQLAHDMRALADPQSQVDPKFQSPFLYTRITAKGMRTALIQEKGWLDEDLPCENTIGNILNRLGYRLRRVQKAKPVQRVEATDAIFENVHHQNQTADQREDSLRLSIDTKAKVDLGDFSRGGQARGQQPQQAWDHDLRTKKN